MRWEHQTYGHLLPQHFIPLAEETAHREAGVGAGGGLPSGAAAWREEYPQTPLAVSINISGRQLQGTGIADALRTALASAGWIHRP